MAHRLAHSATLSMARELNAAAGVGRLGYRVRAWGDVMRVLLALLLVVGMVGSSNESEAAETLTLKGHSQPVRGVSISPDGKRIVSGSHDKTLKVWDPKPGRSGSHSRDTQILSPA